MKIVKLMRITAALLLLGLFSLQAGCRSKQTAQIMFDGEPGRVGSHAAGSEVYNRMVDEAVVKLLSRHQNPVQNVGYDGDMVVAPQRVCFLGVENRGLEELGSFRDDLYENIDSQIVSSRAFTTISRHYLDAGLSRLRLRPDDLYIPENARNFSAEMESMNQPVDYLMYATVTSTNTQDNDDYQRDYRLTLSLVSARTGEVLDKENCMIRKGYNKSVAAKVRNWNPFSSKPR